MEPVFAAVETMKAKWWELWLARIFGKKTTATDSGCTVTMHHWRGRSYLTNCVHDSAHYRSGLWNGDFFSEHWHPECWSAMMDSDFECDDEFYPHDQQRGKTYEESHA